MPAVDQYSFVTDDELIDAYPTFADDAWTITVTGSADDTYVVTVDGTPYSHGPTVGESITQIRDGLVAAMGPTIQGLFLVTAEGSNRMLLVSEVANYSLNVLTSPSSIIATADYTPADRQCALDIMECSFGAAIWGCKLWRGHLVATVHYLKTWGRGRRTATQGPTGQVTSHTQGPFSTSFSTITPGNMDDAFWSTTPEGMQYLALRNSLGSTAFGMRMGGLS